MEFSLTKYGGVKLTYKGYEYSVHCIGANSIRWRCNKRGCVSECRAHLKTDVQKQRVLNEPNANNKNVHNHPPIGDGFCESRQAKTFLLAFGSLSLACAGNILKTCCEGSSDFNNKLSSQDFIMNQPCADFIKPICMHRRIIKITAQKLKKFR